MKAILIRKFGDSSVLEKGEIQKPIPTENEVLVKIKASSVNPIDIKIRSLGLAIAPDLPAILHGDFSGVVESVGNNVSNFKEGDEVFGRYGGSKGHNGGALAEYISVESEYISQKPKNLSFEEAACLPCVSITSWIALQEKIKLQKYDKILIHGGCGGVGHIAIQLAKIQGAEVFTTVSSEEKSKITQTLGADKVIFYKDTSVSEYVSNLTKNQGFEYIFDTVGGNNLDYCFEAAKKNGTILSINTRSSHDLTLMHNKALCLKVIFAMITPKEEISKILKKISTLCEQQKLKVLLHKEIYSFDEIAKAHICLENGLAMGKIALKGWN